MLDQRFEEHLAGPFVLQVHVERRLVPDEGRGAVQAEVICHVAVARLERVEAAEIGEVRASHEPLVELPAVIVQEQALVARSKPARDVLIEHRLECGVRLLGLHTRERQRPSSSELALVPHDALSMRDVVRRLRRQPDAGARRAGALGDAARPQDIRERRILGHLREIEALAREMVGYASRAPRRDDSARTARPHSRCAATSRTAGPCPGRGASAATPRAARPPGRRSAPAAVPPARFRRTRGAKWDAKTDRAQWHAITSAIPLTTSVTESVVSIVAAMQRFGSVPERVRQVAAIPRGKTRKRR